MRNKIFSLISLLMVASMLLASCATPPAPVGPQAAAPESPAQPLVLTILHVGDTHSKMEPSQVRQGERALRHC